MTATTPNRGYPYPEATDPVADGYDAIADLAAALDTDVAHAIADYTAPALTFGTAAGNAALTANSFARFQRSGNRVTGQATLVTSSGLAAGEWRVNGLPYDIRSLSPSGTMAGTGLVKVGATMYVAMLNRVDADSVSFIMHAAAAGAPVFSGAMTANDACYLLFSYETDEAW